MVEHLAAKETDIFSQETKPELVNIELTFARWTETHLQMYPSMALYLPDV